MKSSLWSWVVSTSLQPHGLQLGSPVLHCLPAVCSNSCPLNWTWILSSVIPFSSCLQSFPASVFSNESALRIRWSKYCRRKIPNHRSVLVIQNPSSFLRKWVNFLCLHGHRILIYLKKNVYIFLMWTIFKVFIEFVTTLLPCFGFFGYEVCGILIPGPGIEPKLPALEAKDSAFARRPAKSSWPIL